jgi:hypothetical protein
LHGTVDKDGWCQGVTFSRNGVQNGGNDWGNIGSVHGGLINTNVHRKAW